MKEEKQKLTVEDILKVTNGTLVIGGKNENCEDFCRDSREVKQNDIYLGIQGEKVNGSIFFEEAFEKGAKGAILQNIEITQEQIAKYSKSKFIILVKDTIKAMQQIATYKRNLYNIPVVAITGSVGKTSTKDMLASVLNEKFNTLKTEGNYNNHIGVPLTIFRLKQEEAMVVEMGMSHLGEIRTLSKIAKPSVCVITNVGTSHIGNLGSRENILKAKLEILEGAQENGTLVINNDNDLLHKWYLENKEKYNIVTYGIENESDYMAENIISKENGSTYILKGTEQKIQVPVAGNHFVQNSLCAIAVGSIFSIPLEDIAKGISSFKLTEKRMDITTKNNITIISDYYNANYDSMKAALNYLGKVQGKRKIAVLGDMLELGSYSKELHQKVGEEVIKNKIDILITVGEEAKQIAKVAKENNTNEENANQKLSKQNIENERKLDEKSTKIEKEKVDQIKICNSNQEAIEIINQIKQEKDCILLKASHGMNFGEILEGITK